MTTLVEYDDLDFLSNISYLFPDCTVHSTREPPGTFLILNEILAVEPALRLIIFGFLTSAWCMERRMSWRIRCRLKYPLQDKEF